MLQFDTLPDAEEKTRLATEGINLLSYLGSNAFFASVPAGATATATAGVTRLDIDPAWKTDPLLADGNVPWYAWVDSIAAASVPDLRADSPAVALYVVFHPDVSRAEGMAALARHGGTMRDAMPSINAAVAWLPYDAIAALAEEDAVQWVAAPLPAMTANNDSNRVVTQADQVNAAPYDLDGTGVNVLVYDAGSALASHADFGGRLSVRDSSGVEDHPTHVAGTIGGDGSSSAAGGGTPRQWRGMAPGVTLQSYGLEVEGGGIFLYSNPGDLEANYDEAINVYGAEIANNSIGTNTARNGFPCEMEGDYGVTDALIDAIVRGSLGAPMRIVWANGNERGSTARCGSTYHTTAPPATAKNHITVGALSSDTDAMTSFSSWGPTDDGRLKPDVSAPGCQQGGDQGVTSTIASGGYSSFCGTSMAAPTVTGLSALLLQDWKARFPGAALPRNSTLKALLAHNALDRGNPGPDYQYGYGSVRIRDSIDFLRLGSFRESSLTHGEIKSFATLVPPGTASLRVTVAWDDAPGTPNVIPSLINDLDLVVTDPSGQTVHLPWTLDPAQPATAARRDRADHINNIEQVVADTPAAGVWRISVSGSSVPQGPQPFSLAADGQLVLCSSRGTVAFDRATAGYSCGGNVTVVVNDCDLNHADDAIETVNVQVGSDSEPAGESVLLTETAPNSGSFTGTIALSTELLEGLVTVKNGDTLSTSYDDANDGTGHPAVATATAPIDCVPPTVDGVATPTVGPARAGISLQTDEDATVRIHYGLQCGALPESAASTSRRKTHLIELTGLQPSTTYFFAIAATDLAGNLVFDDNGGACYSFATPAQADYFTEIFDAGDNDLDGMSLTFTPNGSPDFYAACQSAASGFPTDPAGGIPLSLGDDGSQQIVLSGAAVSLYANAYSSLYVNANGNLTFATGDSTYSASVAAHFSQPRIAALFHDLLPNSSTVSWKQLADRVAVTYANVLEFGTTNQNSFQIELFFDGVLRLTWLGIEATRGLAGLSRGTGVPEDFVERDLTGYGGCISGPSPTRTPTVTPTPSRPTATLTPTSPARGLRVLYFEDAQFDSVVPEALARTQLTGATTIPANAEAFRLALADGGPWDLVIYGEEGGITFPTVQTELTNYIAGGGRVLAVTWRPDTMAPFFQAARADLNRNTITTAAHAIFTGLGTSFQAENPGYPPSTPPFARFSVSYTAVADAIPLGPLGNGFAAVLGNGGRTILQGPLFDAFANAKKGEQFVANEIAFLLRLTGPTELFGTSNFDLEFTTLTYTPDLITGEYAVCSSGPTTAFPVDPAGSTALSLGDDDVQVVRLQNGAMVPLFGVPYDRYYVGSNGFITFGDGDRHPNTGYLPAHFGLPRVAALSADLDPRGVAGAVRSKQLADRAVVTFQDVPQFAAPTVLSSFQIELFFNGVVRVTYLRVSIRNGISGLSPGFGLPPGWTSEDLSTGPGCRIPTATPTTTPTGTRTFTPTPTPGTQTPVSERILYFEDTMFDSSVPEALAQLGLTSATRTAVDIADFRTRIGQHAWDLVIFGEEGSDRFSEAQAELTAYVQNGGKLLGTTWLTGGLGTLLLGTPVDLNATSFTTDDHPIFAGVGPSLQLRNPGWNIFTRSWSPQTGAVGLGQHGAGAAVILGNGGRTLLQGPLFDVFADPIEGAHLIANEISFLTGQVSVTEQFTEQFAVADNDLAHGSLTFMPQGSGYTLCRGSADAFHTDPSGGEVLTLPDDGAAIAPLGGGATVALFGVRYGALYVGSNGYVTFTLADGTLDESLENHFSQPRVAALFDDLNPQAGGTVSWKQLVDRVAVTYQDVPQFGLSDANSFQIELFFDGTIRLTFLDISAADGLAGLSAGQGIPSGFIEADLSAAAPCGGGGITVTPSRTPTPTPTETPLPPGGVQMRINPVESSVGPGATFDLAVEVVAGSQTIDGAAAFLEFNPAVLTVVSITPGSSLPLTISNKFSNANGTLDFAAGAFDLFPSGTFTLATIRFTALTGGDSSLHFSTTPPRQSDVTLGGLSRLSGLIDGLVHVATAAFNGSVSLQGRPAAPNPRWSVPLTVQFNPSPSGTPRSCDTTTDSSGAFSCSTVLPPGSYTACAKHAHTIRNCRAVTIPSAPVSFGTLREGDANGDNCVLLIDFSILATTFGKCSGDLGYDSRADFDGSGCVLLVDFSLLATNFGLCGDALPSSTDAETSVETDEPAGSVVLALDPAATSVAPNDTFPVTVQAQAGALAIDGASAYLTFDPAVLEAVSVAPGSALPLVIQNQIDNGLGRVNYAAGTVSDFPSGTVSVVTVTFRALGPSAGSAITFASTVPRLTDVTSGGMSVLSEAQGSTIVVAAAATPASTAMPTATIPPSATSTATAPPTVTATALPTSTATAPPTFTPTARPTSTATALPTFTATAPPTFTATALPTFTATALPTFTATALPTFTATAPPTFTATALPTFTATALPTFTATALPTFTATAPPTFTATALPTFTATAVPTFTATALPTFTGTRQPSSTATATLRASDTPSVEATPTQTSMPSASPPQTATATTVVPACVGDCGGSFGIDANELRAAVEIALGRLPSTDCPSLDPEQSGVVAIDTLITAVNNSIHQCQ